MNRRTSKATALGRHGEELGTIREAVDAHRSVTATGFTAIEPDFACALNGLANAYQDAGNRKGALVALIEAVALLRRANRRDPVAHRAMLAMMLANLALTLSCPRTGRVAPRTLQEAVNNLYAVLAAEEPSVHEPRYATTLLNLGLRQAEQGRFTAALESSDQRLRIHEARWVEGSRHCDDLAFVLFAYAKVRAVAQRQIANGLVVVVRSIGLYTTLAAASPGAHDTDLEET